VLWKCNLDPNTYDKANGMYIWKEKIQDVQNLQEKGQCHPTWNSEIYNLYKALNIMDDIKIKRLGLAGHVTK
jgi:hypothetical protein